MRVNRHDTPGVGPYLTVSVAAGEVFPGTTRSLPYATTIGTLAPDGTVGNVWTPAASVFRGYRAAARAWLTAVGADIRAGRIVPE